MATVEDLYRQVLGREPEPEGLAFWQNAFGGSVDPMEQASFMQAAQAELARRTPAEQAVLAPKLVAEATATGVPVTTVAASVPPPAAPTAPVNPTVKLFQDTLGRAPTEGELERFSGDINAGQLSNFLGYARNQVVNTMPTTGAVGNIANQILAQGTTDKWGGEGFGSAEKNAYDMATMLAGQGIKDINDFGQRTTANGETEFFNKATGEAIKPFYDRAGGNIWGGTFAGKDSTAYGVEFDASGKPLFYSQSGGDSADVPSWVVPALVLGGAYFGLGGLEGLLGGTAGGSLTAGITVADIAAAEAALAGATTAGGLLTAGSLTAGITPAQIAVAEAALPTSGLLSGSLTAGITPTQIAAGEAALPSAGGSLTAGITTADIAASEAGLPSAGSLTAGITTADIAASEAGLPAAVGSLTAGITPTNIAASEAGLPSASVSTNVGNILSNLTPNQIANIVGGFGGLLGGAALTSGGGTGGGVGALPTQGVPLNTADYYNAIQQNYNRLLPAVPRDVATPLAQWYNSQYGA
jgi:hypothetical protein